jgi:hypothetical protein
VWLLLSFGADIPIETWAAVGVWTLIIVAVVVACARGPLSDRRVVLALLLLAQAALMIASALYSSKGQPFAVTTPGGGNRYTWIPYALIFASATALWARSRVAQGATLATIGLLCFWNLHPVALPDLHFASFARFSQTVAMTIPIHPQWPADPGWHVAAGPRPGAPAAPGTELALDETSLRAPGGVLTFERTADGPTFRAEGGAAVVLTAPATSCNDATDLGVEVSMSRDVDGWTRLSWGATADGPDTGSIRRWFPAGRVTARYAFALAGPPVVLRLVPAETGVTITLHRVTVHCLR